MDAANRAVTETAPAKVNLILQVGPRRDDGLHALCSLFASIDRADALRFEVSEEGGADEVICPGVEGPNLVTAALAAYRTSGGELPPLRVEVDKRIPVAAGPGGGSADAAAALRAANRIAGGRLDADRGTLGALISGSGPTVFGVFEDEARAREAAAAIPNAIVAGLRAPDHRRSS